MTLTETGFRGRRWPSVVLAGVVLAYAPPLADGYELVKLVVLQVVLGCWAVALALAPPAATPSGATRLLPRWLRAPLLAWALAVAIATAGSGQPWIAWLGEYESWMGASTLALWAGLLLLTYRSSQSQAGRASWAHGASLTALVAIAMAGIARHSAVAGWLGMPTDSPFGERIAGTMGNPNLLAAMLLLLLPITMLQAWRELGARGRVATLASWIAPAAIVWTGSRIAIATLLLEVVLLALLWRRTVATATSDRARLRGIALACGLAVVALAVTGHGRRWVVAVVQPLEALANSRLELWRPAWRMIADRPLVGHGADAYRGLFPSYASPEYYVLNPRDTVPLRPHSHLLQVAVGCGGLGLVALLWLYGATGRRLIGVLAARDVLGGQGSGEGSGEGSDEDRALATEAGVLAIAGVGHLLVNSFGFESMATGAVFWMLLGRAAAVIEVAQPTTAPAAPVRHVTARRWLLALGGLGLWIVAGRSVVADGHYAAGIRALRAGSSDTGSSDTATAAAIANFDAASRWAPHVPRYRANLAVALEQQAATVRPPSPGSVAQCRRALSEHRRVLALQPVNGHARMGLGRTLLACGPDPDATERGLDALQRAALMRPLDPLAQELYLEAALGRGRLQRAAAAALELGGHDPLAITTLIAAAERIDRSNPTGRDQARDWLRAAHDRDPTRPDALVARGVLELEAGDLTGGASFIDAALARDPNFAPALEVRRILAAGAHHSATAAQPGRPPASSATQPEVLPGLGPRR